MIKSKKITVLQAYMILMLSIGVSNHVLLIPLVLQAAKRDAWISILVAGVPILILSTIWYALIRKTKQQHILTWIQQHFGVSLAWIVRALVMVLLILTAWIGIKDTVNWTKITYLPQTPLWAIALALCILCYFAANLGLPTIAISSGVLLPFVVILGFFVMSVNFTHKNYSMLTPSFTHGYQPVLHGAITALEAFGELIILLFMQHHISSKIKIMPLLVLTMILIGLALGPLMGAIAIYGPFEAADMRYPAFEQWRMVSVGKFVTHLDFLSIYQWLAGSFIRISLSLFILVDLFCFQSKKTRTAAILIISLLFFIMSQIPLSDMTLLHIEKKFLFPYLFVIALLITAILIVLSWIRTIKSTTDVAKE
ncbi:Spore germination protein [compost metagenome]